MNFVISQELLISAFQIIQAATHPTVPYTTVSQVLQALSQLQPVPVEAADDQEPHDNGNAKSEPTVTPAANGRRITS